MSAQKDNELEQALAALTHRDPDRRASAALRLMGIRREPQRCAPALAAALSDPEAFVRVIVASALAEMGPQAKPAIGALGKALTDADAGVRSRAALALGEIGPEARSAVPGLARLLLSDPHPATRRHAAAALGELGLSAVAALPALAEALAAPDLLLRAVAGAALLRLVPRSLPRLVEAAGHPEPSVRGHAARLLAKTGRPEAHEALAILANDADPEVRDSARL